MEKSIKQMLLEYIREHPFDFGNTTAENVMDFIFNAYLDIQHGDPEEIKQGFQALNQLIDRKPVEEAQEIFTTVCELCVLHEKRALTDGFRLGLALAEAL